MKKLVYSFLAFFPLLIFSQGIVNSGGRIIISSGAYVYIDGDAEGDYRATAANSFIDLDGRLIVEGDFLNTSGGNTFNNIDSDGWVEFKGNSNPSISGANTFENFLLEKTAGNIVTLSNADLTINKSLDLSSGVITTGSYKVIMSSNLASDLLDYSSSSFINGNLRRNIANLTSDNYVFPIGRGTVSTNYYRADVKANAMTGVTYIDASVDRVAKSGNYTDVALQNVNKKWNNVDPMISSVEPSGFAGTFAEWTLTPNAQPTGGTTYGIDLYLSNLTGLTDNKFTVMKRPDASINFSDLAFAPDIPAIGGSGRLVVHGYARGNAYTSFSKFAVFSSSNVLPIELIAFKGKCEYTHTVLSWATATEINNDYFTIEKSLDGENYFEIATIPSDAKKGNSTETLSYEYIYLNNTPAYYKLKQTDFDGKFSYSDVIFVENCFEGVEETAFTAYSANNRNILIHMELPRASMYTIGVMDLSGRNVVEYSPHDLQKGNNVIKLPGDRLSTGFYVVHAFNEFEQFSEKLFIK